jgi:hypothetical protein
VTVRQPQLYLDGEARDPAAVFNVQGVACKGSQAEPRRDQVQALWLGPQPYRRLTIVIG